MSACAREHSIRVYFEEAESLGMADFDIEVDYRKRLLGCTFEREACMDWWLWR